MPVIKENIQQIEAEINSIAVSCQRNPESVTLIGVSKRKKAATVQKGIDAGLVNLGENYIQEAVDKIDIIGNNSVSWHFIGNLQSNKAKFAVKYFDLIHTVDKLKLAREIDKQAKKIDKVQDILIQVNVSDEVSKSGTSAKDALELASQISELKNVRLMGLMGMPAFFHDPELARPYFRTMAEIKRSIDQEKIPGIFMEHLSMGMSNDFKVAIEEGSTLVRVGTAIFGERD